MDFQDLTIHQAKSKIEHLENLKELKLKQKEANFMKTQPKSPAMDKVNVDGGTRSDKFMDYVIRDEQIDAEVEYIESLIQFYNEFVDRELKRLDAYDEWEQKVIYMHEQDHMTYFQIACRVPFSERTCKRIYRKYKQQRNV